MTMPWLLAFTRMIGQGRASELLADATGRRA
jgi:hypothetical protein